MTSKEIRGKFIGFFEKKGHKAVKSDLLVPQGDPTLLFTGAGMNQFKEQFMGNNITYSRATSCQKCLRTGDLENVGKTPRHHTFFEMLGNFSFGDYFKREAINWGWEFMTRDMGISPDRLWISVYKDDEESYDIWTKEINIPPGRVVKLGAKDNFWPADAPEKGPNGPCGPCSEIFYDWGADKGCGREDCDPSCDCGRFVEVWNLVFTEFERHPDGSLTPLPNKNIDTGMGLERMVSVSQNVMTNFDTDLFIPLIDEIKKTIGPGSESLERSDLNLIADHIRAVVFCICDGVSPSNENRGYVVRKLIRRTFLKSGMEKPFLFNLVPKVASMMSEVYPEILEKREHISAIVEEEEKRFHDTLIAAMPVFDRMVSECRDTLDGGRVFKLVDTYGLPLDVIEDKAVSSGLKIDIEGYKKLMDERKERSRKGSDISSDFIFKPDLFSDAPKPEYSDALPLEADIVFILKSEKTSGRITEGEEAEVVLSPQSRGFYAESGGQVGDKGVIEKKDAGMRILNTVEADGRKIFHITVEKGFFNNGDKVILKLDEERKRRTARNHTATHLLQSALRRVLGDHVKQSGSFVDEARLRFDFTHMKKVPERELAKIESMVNGWIENGSSVSKEVKPIDEARAEGALSFFGEKYGDTVRVVSIGDVSKEFCGGTHVDNISDIGIVKIVNESSIASGIRRIEALTGGAAEEWVRSEVKKYIEDYRALATDGQDILGSGILDDASALAEGRTDINGSAVNDFEARIKPAFIKARSDLEREAKRKKKSEQQNEFNRVKEELDGMMGALENTGDVNFISGVFEDINMGMLRKAAGYLEKRAGNKTVAFLGSSHEGKAFLVCVVPGDVVSENIDARDIISSASLCIKGSGGGKPTFAQAGGTDPAGLSEAVKKASEFFEQKRG